MKKTQMLTVKNPFILIPILFILLLCCMPTETSFHSTWSNEIELDRSWAGSAYWLNPLQAWRQTDGKMKVVTAGGDRNIGLLTHTLGTNREAFEIEFQFEDFQPISSEVDLPKGLSPNGWIGIQLGLKGQFMDYRDDAVHGKGLSLGYTQSGELFIGTIQNAEPKNFTSEGKIKISGNENSDSTYLVSIRVYNGDKELNFLEVEVHDSWLEGNLALTCSQSIQDAIEIDKSRPSFNEVPELVKRSGGNNTVSFSQWKMKGGKVLSHPDRAYGPILWSQYTLSEEVMKMSVQFAPIGNDNRTSDLYVDGKLIATEKIDELGRNALFRIEQWKSTKDHNYAVHFHSKTGKHTIYEGTIKADDFSNNLKVASLSCIDDRGFPHQEIVDHVADHSPDMLIFHGDQLYERVGGYGVERNSILDYQRKWYLFGWTFGPLIKDHPTVIIPDDHDVFHGNLWGEGGKAADLSQGYGNFGQDSGGYKEPPEFVNMVHRTQTGHLPDPVDPRPVDQDISVYYTNMNYGGVSFAILGDRQWKTAPKQFFPKAEIENGWPQNIKWNPKTEAFHPEAELLGPRQESFLNQWVENWKSNIMFKTVISQSPFCNVATLPADIWHDKYVPGLPRYKQGEYPDDDRPVADFDSNGWPQNKRDLAIETIRKAHALHITGDQHLGSTGKYGVDKYGDSGYWLSTPAVSNLWPRRWFPAAEAQSGKSSEDQRRYTGDYEDGFGNKITVQAIANPYDIDKEPSMVYDKAPGYSIVEYDLNSGNIHLSVWPRWTSPKQAAPNNKPYDDWPISISQADGYGMKGVGTLPALDVKKGDLVSIYREDNDELISIGRVFEDSYEPKVFDLNTTYRVYINEKRKDGVKPK